MNFSRLLLYIIIGVTILMPIQLLSQPTSTAQTKIGIISDLHYLSSGLRDIGYKTQEISESTGKNIMASSEVLKETIAKLDSANIDVLLIPGDLTFEGEKQSHLELKDKLDYLQSKGIRIFVIPGNHDINNPAAKGFRGNVTYTTSSVTSQEFVDIYDSFGYNNAISRDENSLSYINEIDKDTWILALDVANYQDKADRNIGNVNGKQRQWIQNVLKDANEKKKRVIAMMHWGLLEHIPMQSQLLPTYLVSDADSLNVLLADNGVEVVFTGHFHANDINKYTTDKSNTIYDIATGALVSYPYVVRFAELNIRELKIDSRFLYQTSSYPRLREDSKDTLTRLAGRRSLSFIQKLGFDFSNDNLQILSGLVAKYFVASMQGDEQFDHKDIEQIQKIFQSEGFPVSEAILSFDLGDTSDNQITISFSNSVHF